MKVWRRIIGSSFDTKFWLLKWHVRFLNCHLSYNVAFLRFSRRNFSFITTNVSLLTTFLTLTLAVVVENLRIFQLFYVVGYILAGLLRENTCYVLYRILLKLFRKNLFNWPKFFSNKFQFIVLRMPFYLKPNVMNLKMSLEKDLSLLWSYGQTKFSIING